MNKKGLTLVEMIITIILLIIFLNGISFLSTFYRKAECRLEANTLAMYSLESVRNLIIVDLRSGKKAEDINQESYKKTLSKFPFPIKLSKRQSSKIDAKVIRISLKCPVMLQKNQKKIYFREIIINE